MLVGVLALQGDFREHISALAECGVEAIPVKHLSEVDDIDALVLPGGESTTIAKLARTFGLFDRISERIHGGMPTYGSCAGMILLADRIEGAAAGQESFGGLDITVRRNAFGRQVDSFESDLNMTGITAPAIRAVFIRAPWVEALGPSVEVLASVESLLRCGRAISLPPLFTRRSPGITGFIATLLRRFVRQMFRRTAVS